MQERASYRGILVGFSENQYKILNPNNDKIYWSRNVKIMEGIYNSSENSVEGGYLDFNQNFENEPNLIPNSKTSENLTETRDNRISSEISEDIDHVTRNRPQFFKENPEIESSEDELIRTYISIDRSKPTDPETFKESQNSPNAIH